MGPPKRAWITRPTNGTLQFEANQTLQAITIPLLQNPAATGTKYFTVTLSNASGGIPLGIVTTRVNILHPKGYYPIVPWIDAKPRLARENGVNLLSWEGDGVLQRADQVTGPWEDLAQVSSPYATRPSLPMGFYRIQHSPRPTEVYVPSGYDGQTRLPLILALHGLGPGENAALGCAVTFLLSPWPSREDSSCATRAEPWTPRGGGFGTDPTS